MSDHKVSSVLDKFDDAKRQKALDRDKALRGGDNGGNGGNTPMNDLAPRVEHLEHEVVDIRVSLARIETKLDNCVTKAQLSTYALVALLGIVGGAWWVVQQYLAPILQATGAG